MKLLRTISIFSFVAIFFATASPAFGALSENQLNDNDDAYDATISLLGQIKILNNSATEAQVSEAQAEGDRIVAVFQGILDSGTADPENEAPTIEANLEFAQGARTQAYALQPTEAPPTGEAEAGVTVGNLTENVSSEATAEAVPEETVTLTEIKGMISGVNDKLDGIDSKVSGLGTQVDQGFNSVDSQISDLGTKIEDLNEGETLTQAELDQALASGLCTFGKGTDKWGNIWYWIEGPGWITYLQFEGCPEGGVWRRVPGT